MEKKKILYITYRLPFPPTSGEKIRSFYTIKYLASKYNVVLISFIENHEELKYAKEYSSLYSKIYIVKRSNIASLFFSFIGLFSKKPLQVSFYYSFKMKKIITKELNKDYDTIFCHLIRMGQYIPQTIKTRKIIDMTDAISLNFQRAQKYRKGLWQLIYKIENKRLYNYELNCIKKFDYSIFISKIDANYLMTEENKNNIYIIPNGVKSFSSQKSSFPKKNNTIMFLGWMKTFPNEDAVLYFTQEILPLIRNKIKDVKFIIVGGSPTKKIQDLENSYIKITGFVDTIEPYFKASKILVAPMRTGAGMQNKILEAMSFGLPVITTSIGAEGIESNSLIIKNTPEEFANTVVSLLKDDEIREKLSVENKTYVNKYYNWKTLLSQLDKFIE